jgi:hypothetical protein
MATQIDRNGVLRPRSQQGRDAQQGQRSGPRSGGPPARPRRVIASCASVGATAGLAAALTLIERALEADALV